MKEVSSQQDSPQAEMRVYLDYHLSVLVLESAGLYLIKCSDKVLHNYSKRISNVNEVLMYFLAKNNELYSFEDELVTYWHAAMQSTTRGATCTSEDLKLFKLTNPSQTNSKQMNTSMAFYCRFDILSWIFSPLV